MCAELDRLTQIEDGSILDYSLAVDHLDGLTSQMPLGVEETAQRNEASAALGEARRILKKAQQNVQAHRQEHGC
jgi:hypothetical protein